MSQVEDFLVEIGTEELPPNDLEFLSLQFAEILENSLIKANIKFNAQATEVFATPRRLGIFLKDVALQQQDSVVEKRGPAITATYNADGSPTKAALGFAASCGVPFNEITELKTEKGAWLHFKQSVAGKKTTTLLSDLVQQALLALPIKRNMHWGKGEISFVRPVHWIVMMHGKNIVPGNIFGLSNSNISYGHRIHASGPIIITSPNTYVKQLADAKVLVSFAARRNYIAQLITDLAKQQHGTSIIDPNLLDQVTGLVEHPVALAANFKAEFLRVPKECLISAMQDHQKCFALLSADGKLMPKFILISNLESTDPQVVINGNELVMNARLADAAFYFDKDQQQALENRVEQLKTVVYQKKIGSLYDKVLRIKKLATMIAVNIGANVKDTERAAYLCKADLLTNMVYEFPELQGIMGKYYALHDQESPVVANAIEEHYKPKFATDSLPKSKEAICIALADRIDTLVGFFGIGNIPTGEKDPFALRRQALAVMRLLIALPEKLDLAALLATAFNNYEGTINNYNAELITFCFERFKAYFLSDFTPQMFAAVVAMGITSPLDFYQRLQAVKEFQALPVAASLAAANKRVQNILEKNNVATNSNPVAIEVRLLTTPEQNLFAALQQKEAEIAPLLVGANYAGILHSLATLQEPVDQFFTEVMVMVDDPMLRSNRISLLQRVRNLFLQVADVSLL